MSGSVDSWRAFESNEITHSGAHYLLAVEALVHAGEDPRAADVARYLGVSRAATSLQLRSLMDGGLVERTRAQRWRLTVAGQELVNRVAGKREVVRIFLNEILGVRAETAEVDACKVEHLLSEETGAALVRLIRFLRSEHPEAGACLEAFRDTVSSCPPGARCEICAEVCLLAAGAPEATS